MTGKELILKAVRGEETGRPAWMPFVGAHGGFMIGKGATEYMKSAALTVEAMKKAKEMYKPDGLPIMFDLQMEAEVLGCDLHWTDDGPPSVTSHPLEGNDDWSADQVPDLDLSAGRWPVAMEAVRLAKKELGDEIALYGLICGPFTLALHLLGNDIFLEMFDEEEKVEALTMRCADIAIAAAGAYIDNGCDVIAVVDPMVSQISPDHFAQFVTPAMNKVFDYIRSRGSLSSCFVCGDVTRNLEVMLETTCDNVSVDEQIDMANLRVLAGKYGKSFGGNLHLTTVLLMGTIADCQREAIGCIETCGTKGFIMSPGCDLPYDTPPANVAAAGLMAVDPEQMKQVKETLGDAENDTYDDVIIPDYANENAVLVDLITLDSESCAPCTYMTDAANRAAAALTAEGYDIKVKEYKIRTRQGVGMLVKLGAKNIPTICIEGVPTFESLIPEQPKLIAAIREVADKKGARK